MKSAASVASTLLLAASSAQAAVLIVSTTPLVNDNGIGEAASCDIVGSNTIFPKGVDATYHFEGCYNNVDGTSEKYQCAVPYYQKYASKDCSGSPSYTMDDAKGCELSTKSANKKTNLYSCEDAMKKYTLLAAFKTSTDCTAGIGAINVRPYRPLETCVQNGGQQSSKYSCKIKDSYIVTVSEASFFDTTCGTATGSGGSDKMCDMASDNSWVRQLCWDEATLGSGSTYGNGAPASNEGDCTLPDLMKAATSTSAVSTTMTKVKNAMVDLTTACKGSGATEKSAPTSCDATCKAGWLKAKPIIQAAFDDVAKQAPSCKITDTLLSQAGDLRDLVAIFTPQGRAAALSQVTGDLDKLCGTGSSGIRVELTVLSLAAVVFASVFTMF